MKSVFLILARLIIITAAASMLAPAQTYSFKHYTSADGLELSSNSTIFQDSRGSLWFGGFGGAFRYDGDRFIPYLSKGAERSVVTRFSEDHNGTIWIATEGNGIAKIRYGRNNSIEWMTESKKHLPSDSIYALLRDSSGAMFVGTRKGVKVFWNDGSSTLLTKDSGLYSNWARMMARDHEGGIWIGTNGGVTRYTVRQNKIVSWKKIHDATTLSLIVRKDGTVVIGTMEGKNEKNKGVFGYHNNILYRIIDQNDFSDPIKTQSLLEDSRGNLWIGTTRGIILKNGTRTSRIRTAQGLASESIGCILEDRDGSIWCATGNGAVKLPSRYTVNYTELQGISGILTVLAETSNAIWCGGFSPLYRIGIDNKVRNMSDDPKFKDVVVLSIAQDLQGYVWFGTLSGLFMYDGKSFIRQKTGGDVSKIMVSSVIPDTNGGVWVGMKGKILNIRNKKILTLYDRRDSIPDDDISGLMVGVDGRLWFRADRGCGVIDKGRLTMFTMKDGLPSDDVEYIKEDSRGRIWFVTRTGVVYRKDGKFIQLSHQQFPIDDVRVTVIHEDSSGHIWFGTMFGVIEWSDSVLARYDTRDGLSGDIVKGIAEDNEGNLWFATNGGLTKFPHSERMSNIPTPSIRIERISDEAVQNILTEQTVIPYEDRTVTFQAVSFSFYDEQNMEFQFMLHGIDNEWNAPTKQRSIRYTTLPAGQYTLHVRARNRNGYWTEPTRYSFVILPPFWKTWWFTSLVTIIVLGAAYGVVRQRFRRLQQQAESQEHFSKQLMNVYESERKRIASELHDGLGQNLLIIANRAKMGLRKEETSAMQKEFEIISSSALESINDVRKITYNLHPLQIDEVGITAAIESMLKRMSTVMETSLTFTVEQIDGLLLKEQKIHFYRLLQEMLSNAMKHSDATAIEITIVKDDDSIRAIVKDNGKGFDPKENKEGYGMRSLNERVKILGGAYQIDSSHGKGTIVKINIPIRTEAS